MLLGEIMNQLKVEDTAATALAALGDIVLIAEIDEIRIAHDESRGSYVAGAAQRFTRIASDDDWLKLMTALERSDAPAATCLTTMVRWSIARDLAELRGGRGQGGCSCGQGDNCHDHA